MGDPMKRVSIESLCPKARLHEWHVWVATAHDARWSTLRCSCTRCGDWSQGSSRRYDSVRAAIDEVWASLNAK